MRWLRGRISGIPVSFDEPFGHGTRLMAV
jgi:hypothetical protein